MESGLKRGHKKKESKFHIFILSEVHVCNEGWTRKENTSFFSHGYPCESEITMIFESLCCFPGYETCKETWTS